jgi:peptidyl-prolyl cis-trans isomerase SurA
MALVRRSARRLAAAAIVVALAGCSARPGTQTAWAENQKMDCMIRCGEELERESKQPSVVRSQAPEVLPPTRVGRAEVGTTKPAPPTPGKSVVADPIAAPDVVVPPSTTVQPAAAAAPAAGESLAGDPQVRIVASIGKTPIYESEVREAVYNRLSEYSRLPDAQRQAKEKELFREELRKIIERELVLDEMFARLTAMKQTALLGRIRDGANKEAEFRIKEIKKEIGVPSDDVFRDVLRSRGLTLDGLKRQFARGFMMNSYLRQTAGERMNVIALDEIREYYATHPEQFKAEEKVVWLDLFVMNSRFKTPDEAKLYAAHMHARAAKGEDFAKLASEHGMGDAKLRNGAGIGEKPGEIFPQDLEPTLLAMNAGQVAVKETETGYHVLKVTERTRAGTKPLDEKVQAEIRKKIQNQVYDREAKRLIETLWKRSQPQVWID